MVENERKKRIYTNYYSERLDFSERTLIDNIMGLMRVFTTMAISKLYLTSSPRHDRWNEHAVGVACFVRDRIRKGYYLQFVDIDKRIMVWEEEIYSPFTLQILSPRFVAFETKICVAGLALAYADEASLFFAEIGKVVNKFNRRTAAQTNILSEPIQPIHLSPIVAETLKKKKESNKEKKGVLSFLGFKKAQKPTRSLEISAPTNFVHVNANTSSEITKNDIPEDKWHMLEILLNIPDGANERDTAQILKTIELANGVDNLIDVLTRTKTSKDEKRNKRKSSKIILQEDSSQVSSDFHSSNSICDKNIENFSEVTKNFSEVKKPELQHTSSVESLNESIVPKKLSLKPLPSIPLKTKSLPPIPPQSPIASSESIEQEPVMTTLPEPLLPPPPPPRPPSEFKATKPPIPSKSPIKLTTESQICHSDDGGMSALLSAIQKGTTLKKVDDLPDPRQASVPISASSSNLDNILADALSRMRTDFNSDSEDQSDLSNSFDEDD